ncbi:hypothetical protein K432DRAFT_389842 [Lepidopterella palustris CBS 459.81]|uniref:Signal transduction histidine kinase dimerisation/phosphoacceptor domain-containing protein n=1 Tax=Lepidopterella palustris CBS 459.81 TaxID=1314670 RepID=A0A8E2JIN1_9PEZI|nr:hypothetical protein K432DRAFT_389842 [Lepidopterella palustris CBS 459.81]
MDCDGALGDDQNKYDHRKDWVIVRGLECFVEGKPVCKIGGSILGFPYRRALVLREKFSAPFCAGIQTSGQQKPRRISPLDDERVLHKIFPRARYIAICSLWDSDGPRWFAGTIIQSIDSMRILSNAQELSNLAAFGNSVRAGVAILDTKLAHRAKADFISSISHELRVPLHGILGSCTELCKD